MNGMEESFHTTSVGTLDGNAEWKAAIGELGPEYRCMPVDKEMVLPDGTEYYSAEDVARTLGVPLRMVQLLEQRGHLSFVYYQSERRYPAQDVRNVVAEIRSGNIDLDNL